MADYTVSPQSRPATYLGLSGHRLVLTQMILIVFPSFFIIGYGLSVLGGLSSQKDFYTRFPAIRTSGITNAATLKHNSNVQGATQSLFSVGCMFGALSCLYLSDAIGRKKSIFLGAIVGIIGAVLQCSAFSLGQLIAGRFLCGVGAGVLTSAVPTWQAEMGSIKNRGQHVVCDGIFLAFGIMSAAWIDLGLSFSTVPDNFRIALAIPILMFIPIGLSIPFMPESPRYLAMKGQMDEAARVMRCLSAGASEDYIRGQLENLVIALEMSKHGRFTDIFKMGPTMGSWRAFLAIMTQFYQQMCGSSLISYYSTTLFEEIGLAVITSRIMSGVLLTWKMLASCIAFFTIEKFGRTKLLALSGGGMGVSMIVLTICVRYITSGASKYIAAVILFVFNFFYPIGLLGVNFLYCTEIGTPHLRGPTTAFSSGTQYLFQFLVAEVTPTAIATIGWRYYIVFAVIGCSMPFFVYFFMPETTGRSLEDMDLLFQQANGNVLIPPRLARKPIQRITKADVMDVEMGSIEDEENIKAEGGRAAHFEGKH